MTRSYRCHQARCHVRDQAFYLVHLEEFDFMSEVISVWGKQLKHNDDMIENNEEIVWPCMVVFKFFWNFAGGWMLLCASLAKELNGFLTD